jgi:hypothetical protein
MHCAAADEKSFGFNSVFAVCDDFNLLLSDLTPTEICTVSLDFQLKSGKLIKNV